MSNLNLNHLALEECLRTLNHLFIDITRLTYEHGYEEIVGGYCELKVATLDGGIPTAKLVAAKRLRLGVRPTEPKRLAFRLARELKVWAGLQHPHVLPLLGFYLDNDCKSAVLISEYMNHGDLKSYIAKVKPSLDERLSLVRDLTDGLTYLHTQDVPIRHGDLKPGNVLVNSGRRALLADFGLSKALDTGPTGFTTGNDAKCTVRYSSPEVLREGTVAESLPNDIWSWGCLALEALTDKIPFSSIQPEPQLIFALMQGKSPSDDMNYSFLPVLLVNLLVKCWSLEPNDRPTAAHCLDTIDSLPSSPPPLPPQRPHITPRKTSPQNGTRWSELQQRYVSQVQQAQHLNQNSTEMVDELQRPHQQEGSQLNRLGNETPLNSQQFRLNPQAAVGVATPRQNQQGGAGLYSLAMGQVPPHMNNQLAALSRTKPNTHIFGSGPNAQQQTPQQPGAPALPGLGLANGAGVNGGGAGGPVEALQNQNQNQNPNPLLQIAAPRPKDITTQQFASLPPQQLVQLLQLWENQHQQQQQVLAQAQAQTQHQLQQQQQQQQASQRQQDQLGLNPGQGEQQQALGGQIPALGQVGQSSGGFPAVQSPQQPQTTVQGTSTTSTSLSSFSNELDAASSFNFTLTPATQRSSLNNNMGSLFALSDINDMTLGLDEIAAIRRSNPDDARLHKRSVKSEDFSSLREPRLVPSSNIDFIRNMAAADESLARIDRRSPPLGGPGPQRQRGSGSGHGRGSSLGSLPATLWGQQGGQPHAVAAQQQKQQPTPASPRVPSIRPHPTLQASPKAPGQPPRKQADPAGIPHRTGTERSSLKRRAEDDAVEHRGSPGPSSSSKRARKISRRL
ncbi:hypothetical protein FS837_004315 [Tulasnella sp. UAMH 9824]|nr:hypothetical protein FS837_004315 [Tulasnella sp. UAMH 9824]